MVRQGTQPLNDYLRIFEALNDAVERLGKVSDSPRLDAELLLARALEVQRSYLFAHPEDEIDPAAAIRFESALANSYQWHADGLHCGRKRVLVNAPGREPGDSDPPARH